jgi:hypothetical protein
MININPQVNLFLSQKAPHLLPKFAEIEAKIVQLDREKQVKVQIEDNLKLAQMNEAGAKSAIQTLPSEQFESESPPINTNRPSSPLLPILTLGLSFLLMLGICDLLSIPLRTLQQPSQYQYFLIFISLIAACCITLTIKLVMKQLAITGYKGNRLIREQDDSTTLARAAWNLRLLKNDWGALVLGCVFIIFESCFAYPGLLSLIPPQLSHDLVFKCSLLAAAALAGTANVCFGFISGVEEATDVERAEAAKYERSEKLAQIRNSDVERRICESNYYHERVIEESGVEVLHFTRKLEEQRTVINILKDRIHREQGEWESAVARLYEYYDSVVTVRDRSIAVESSTYSISNGAGNVSPKPDPENN